jgi:hypothetical protein
MMIALAMAIFFKMMLFGVGSHTFNVADFKDKSQEICYT